MIKKSIRFRSILLIFFFTVSILSMSFMSTATANGARAQIKLYLAGDSVVAYVDLSYYPDAGWGMGLKELFDSDCTVVNRAVSGESSRSFYDKGYLKRILNKINAGDYLFIHFGGNDADKKRPDVYAAPFTTYKEYLKKYIDDARDKGAIPVLVTPQERRYFDSNGAFIPNQGDYPAAMRQLAKEENVKLIDLNKETGNWIKAAGDEVSKSFFQFYGPGLSRQAPEGKEDNTHMVVYGARRIAEFIRQEIVESVGKPLVDYLKPMTRVEAEDMTLSSAKKEMSPGGASSNTTASGPFLVSFQTKGTASFVFPLEKGKYQFKINYFDATDGNSTYKLFVGKVLIGTWNGSDNDNRYHYKDFTEVAADKGDTVMIEATGNGKDTAKLDYIDIVSGPATYLIPSPSPTVKPAPTPAPAPRIDCKYHYGEESLKLNALHLYDGISKTSFVPDLGKSVDIQTGIILLIKAIGKDKAALSMTETKISGALSEYKDRSRVYESAKPYVAYAVENKIFTGATSTTIEPASTMTGQMYASMILRALGYKVAKADTSLATLQQKGGLTSDEVKYFDRKLIKDDWVGMTFGALNAKCSNGKLLIENLIADNAVAEATAVDAGVYTIVPDPYASSRSIISDLVCYDKDNAANWSIASNMRTGIEQYGDCKFLITDVPAQYAGCDWIKTACSTSASYTGGTLCKFKVKTDCTVYILYSDSVKTPAAWVATNFTKSKDQFKSDDGSTYSIYEKNFPAGSTIALGNNGNYYEKGYTVVVKKYTGASLGAPVNFIAPLIIDLVVNDADSAPLWSIKSSIQLGQDRYADLPGWTIENLPAAYLGCDWIQTACYAKRYTGAALCTFKVTSDATVYVLYSNQVTPLPSWLSGFEDTGGDMSNIYGDNDPDTYSIYAKDYTAGSTVMLGNNGSTYESCYSVIVKRN